MFFKILAVLALFCSLSVIHCKPVEQAKGLIDLIPNTGDPTPLNILTNLMEAFSSTSFLGTGPANTNPGVPIQDPLTELFNAVGVTTVLTAINNIVEGFANVLEGRN